MFHMDLRPRLKKTKWEQVKDEEQARYDVMSLLGFKYFASKYDSLIEDDNLPFFKHNLKLGGTMVMYQYRGKGVNLKAEPCDFFIKTREEIVSRYISVVCYGDFTHIDLSTDFEGYRYYTLLKGEVVAKGEREEFENIRKYSHYAQQQIKPKSF